MLIAQQNNEVPGQLIIQFKPGIEQNHKSLLINYNSLGFTLDRCLSEELGIWLCKYDDASDGHDLLHSLRNEKFIMHAQPDHFITQRDVIPDDPSFDMQWALYNNGQSGGIPDADIDATKAWEINVNEGTTILGDSIVIAVIDDGFDLEHEDLNFWKNRNEIPDNGIDDDGNGYIDDYDGWNAYSASGEIPERSHGTRVAGIAAAVGNNGIGICGVGWNCKIMPVAGSSTFESTVVAAFSYVYKMRALYEETNGEKGAYIVVTNGSFGVDFADPEDYPIWSMMYDSLGSLGILNSAATMNHESNVDIVGDVPTNFDSDYLIGVTNTTRKDVKYDVAAWGITSIDLGAPGSSILSTKTNNTYGYSTGTSLAAPQLSGSIGLLFAAADEQFLQTYEQQPGESSKFIKDIILDNVDTLPGFDTLCASGGRLNVDKAMRALLSPRMLLEMDTLRVFMQPDSSANEYILLTNLAGFELGYIGSIESLPDWIFSWTTGGSLPEYGHENLMVGLRTDGMEYGVYYSTYEIRDYGGWLIPLVLELNVVDDIGLDETEYSVLKRIFPNPFNTKINIGVETHNPCHVLFRIYSLSGELVDSWEQQLAAGARLVSRDYNYLSDGVYVIDISGEGIHDQQKLIKTSR